MDIVSDAWRLSKVMGCTENDYSEAKTWCYKAKNRTYAVTRLPDTAQSDEKGEDAAIHKPRKRKHVGIVEVLIH